MKKNGYWFAWHPVKLGALGVYGPGRWVWLKTVWRSTTYPVIYQSVEDVERWENYNGDIEKYQVEVGQYQMAISIHTKDNPPAVFFIENDVADRVIRGNFLSVILGKLRLDGIPHFFHATDIDQGKQSEQQTGRINWQTERNKHAISHR